jgi:hypothetical protein
LSACNVTAESALPRTQEIEAMMTKTDYDPQTWTPDEVPEFTGTEIGQHLTPFFRQIHDLTAGPFDDNAHAQAASSLHRLIRPERLMTPEEEFVASRMAHIARRRVEQWAIAMSNDAG